MIHRIIGKVPNAVNHRPHGTNVIQHVSGDDDFPG
jgi:hypothetical protein